MIKINLISILLILVFICGLSQSQTLLPAENAQAGEIYNQLVGIYPPSPPCQTPLFSCKQYNSTFYTVTQINIFFNSIPNFVFNADFSVFTNCASMSFINTVSPPLNFFQSIQNLTVLDTIKIDGDYQIIDSDFTFPQSLQSITFGSFIGEFQCKWINKNLSSLTITNANNFTIVGDFSNMVDGSLSSLVIPLPNLPIPYFSTAFPLLNSVEFYMINVTYGEPSSLIPSSYFGISFSATALKYVIFKKNIQYIQPAQLFQFPDLSGQLSHIGILADYFSVQKGDPIDFSNCHTVSIDTNINLFKNCDGCLKFGVKTQFNLYNVTVNLESTDFSNLNYLEFYYVQPLQKFIGKNFNYGSCTGFYFQDSQFYGDLSESFCLINDDRLQLQRNLFNGTIPSCYLCTSPNSEVRSYILPNQFTNFDSSTPFVCSETIEFDPIQPLYIIDTYGGDVNITGKNFGLSLQSVVPSGNLGYYFKVPNSILTLQIDSGNGQSNRSLEVTFLNGQNITILYTYVVPYITSYVIENGLVYFYGNGLDYINSNNNVTINGNTIQGRNQYYDDRIQLGHFYIDESLFNGFDEDQTLEVYITCAGIQSETVTFKYFSSDITVLNDEISKLNSTGSTITISGNFLTSDITGVKVLVGDVVCTINNVSPTSLTYTYPGSDKFFSKTNFQINVFGKPYFGFVDITYQNPPTPSPTSTPTPSNPSTPTPSTPSTTSSSSEEVSSSIKLNFSFTLILFIFALLQL